jgi:hypothetical protein
MSRREWIIARPSNRTPGGWVYFTGWLPLDGGDDEPLVMPRTSWWPEDAARMPKAMAERIADEARKWAAGYGARPAP